MESARIERCAIQLSVLSNLLPWLSHIRVREYMWCLLHVWKHKGSLEPHESLISKCERKIKKRTDETLIWVTFLITFQLRLSLNLVFLSEHTPIEGVSVGAECQRWRWVYSRSECCHVLLSLYVSQSVSLTALKIWVATYQTELNQVRARATC